MARSLFFIFCCLLCIFSVGNALAEEEVSPQVQELFQQAWDLERLLHKDLANLDKGREYLVQALELAPDSSEAHWRMAEMLFKIADNKTDPKEANALFLKSVEHAERAVEIKPDSVGGLYWVGCTNAAMADKVGILKALGRVKAAKKNLLAAIEAGGDHRFATLSYAIVGLIYGATPWPLRDMDKAMEYCQAAIDRDPNLTMARVHMAKVLIKAKKYDKARAELEYALATQNPTYIWDAEIIDWPAAKELLQKIEKK